MSLLLNFSFLLALYEVVFAVQPCQTPRGSKGICVSLQDCTDYRQAPSAYLRRSLCDYHGSERKVCCPTKLPIETKSKTPVIETDLLPDKDTCGVQGEDMITGGEVTDLGEHPWMARLEYKDSETDYEWAECGGVLISERYVLTAAHCVKEELFRVTLGAWNVSNVCYSSICKGDCVDKNCAPPAIQVPVEKKTVFPSYQNDDPTVYHDIALLKLKEKVKFSEFVKPICLPTTTDEIFNFYMNKNMTIAGWGATESERDSAIKLKVTLPVTRCRNELLDAGQICAGGKDGKDSCRGDSGGPLMMPQLDENYDVNWYVIGILSNGPKKCGQKNRPGVYTKVAKYLYWIVGNMEP